SSNTASAVPQAAVRPTAALVGFIPGMGDALDVNVVGTLAFTASDTFGLTTVNVSNLSAPVVAGSSNVPFFGQRIAVSGSRAVVGGVTSQGLAQLWVLDLTD